MVNRTAALVLLVGAVLMTAWRWGSFVAGGSDSACYATQAVRWAEVLRRPGRATLQPPDPLALSAPWPDAAATFTPTGHVPSPTVPGAFVPICAAGLSLLMAPLYLLGGPAVMFIVIPLMGAVLVLATCAIGSRFGPRTGVAAAALTAASPVFLYQIVQPMSDIPAAALWAVAIACATGTGRRHAVLAGLATSAAVFVRPNLVPLGIVIGLFLLFRPERTWARRLRSGAEYAAASAPGCLAVAAVQQSLYGSPLASGYGSFEALFSWSHVVPNLTRYAAWLWHAESPAILLAALAPVLLPGPLTVLLLSLFAVNVLLYLPYVVFEDWSYLRFLLPTLPLLLVLVAATLDGLTARVLGSGLSPGEPARRGRMALVMAAAVAAIGVSTILQARSRHAFELQSMEARFRHAGRFVAERLPADAMVITDYESASVPFYSGRRTLAWRALDPAWLDRAIRFVRDRGFEPYLLFERWEEPEFRERFSGTSIGLLDWPPIAEVARQVRIYRVADQERYHRGEAISTEYAR
jgi:hypothetical protein